MKQRKPLREKVSTGQAAGLGALRRRRDARRPRVREYDDHGHGHLLDEGTDRAERLIDCAERLLSAVREGQRER